MKVIEGIGVNGEMELNKEKKNIIGITQSGLILDIGSSYCLYDGTDQQVTGDCTGNNYAVWYVEPHSVK